MIRLHNVSQSYQKAETCIWVLRQQSLVIGNRERLGIFAAKGSGKSTLAHLLSGLTRPNHGSIQCDAPRSWPIGSAGVLHQHLTVSQNIETVARLATATPNFAISNLWKIIGDSLPVASLVRDLPPSDRALLAYGLSLMLPRQHYIFDDKVTIGSTEQRQKQDVYLQHCLASSGLILISSNTRLLTQYCFKFLELRDGQFINRSAEWLRNLELSHV